MKKCLQLLLMLCILVLGAQSAFAGGLLGGTGVSEDRVYDQDGMLKIKTLAIAAPIYNGPKTEGEPEVEDLPEILMEGTLADKKGVLNYISYRDVCQNIKVAKHIDILRDRFHRLADVHDLLFDIPGLICLCRCIIGNGIYLSADAFHGIRHISK